VSPGDEAVASPADVVSRVVFTSAAGLASHHCFSAVSIVYRGSGGASPVPGAGKESALLIGVGQTLPLRSGEGESRGVFPLLAGVAP